MIYESLLQCRLIIFWTFVVRNKYKYGPFLSLNLVNFKMDPWHLPCLAPLRADTALLPIKCTRWGQLLELCCTVCLIGSLHQRLYNFFKDTIFCYFKNLRWELVIIDTDLWISFTYNAYAERSILELGCIVCLCSVLSLWPWKCLPCLGVSDFLVFEYHIE